MQHPVTIAGVPAAHHPSRSATTLLAIETAGSGCSAVVGHDHLVMATERQPMRHGHAEALFPLIERVTAAAGVLPTQLDVVAVATGPGGFTGIRVGLAAAHGIALGSRARLIGLSCFAAVAAVLVADGTRGPTVADQALLVALDSRRADFYVQLFAPDMMAALAEPAAVLPDHLADYIAHIAGNGPLLIAGDAALRAAAALDGRNGITVAADSAPDARGVFAAAWQQLRSSAASGPARPLYLRPPDVTLSKRPALVSVGTR